VVAGPPSLGQPGPESSYLLFTIGPWQKLGSNAPSGSAGLESVLSRREKSWSFEAFYRLLFGVDFSAVSTLGHVSGAFNPTFRVVEPG